MVTQLTKILFSQAPIPGPEVDPQAMGTGLVDALGNQNWGLVFGCALMILVWVLRLVWPNLNKKALPWVAVAIGAASAVGAALIAAPTQWLQALLAGVGAGLSAAGVWGLFGFIRK
jgi:hypothetical protein